MRAKFLLAVVLVVVLLIPSVGVGVPMTEAEEELVIRISANESPGCGGCECEPCYERVYNHSAIRMLGGRTVQSLAQLGQPVDSGAFGELPEGWECSPGLCSCEKLDLVPLEGEHDVDGTPLGFIRYTGRFGQACSMNP